MWLPRFGAAYQIDSKTVLRGGYGVYYDTLNAQNQAPDSPDYPRDHESHFERFRSQLAVRRPSKRRFAFNRSVPHPIGWDSFRHAGWECPRPTRQDRHGLDLLDYDVPRARQQRWRLDIQRQIGSNMMVSVAYAGTYSNDVRVNRRLIRFQGNTGMPHQLGTTPLQRT